MPASQRDAKNSPTKTKYRWIRSWLTVLLILLLAVVALIPGVLNILYRADAQVALGHAKTVRMALKTTAIEQYGVNGAFSDASCQGGVAEGLYEDIIWLSKAPVISGSCRQTKPVTKSASLSTRKESLPYGTQPIPVSIPYIMKVQ